MRAASFLCIHGLTRTTRRYLSDDCILSFHHIMAMLRLGDKYKLDSIYTEAIRRLKQCFPEDLKDYATNFTDSEIVYGDEEESPRFFMKSSTSLGTRHCIALLSIARTHGLDSLLPRIFFSTMGISRKCIANPYQDGTGASWELSKADVAAWIHGREMLTIATRRHFSWFLSEPPESCESKSACAKASALNAEHFWSARLIAAMTFVDSGCIDYLPGTYCDSCEALYKSMYDKELLVTWSMLPSYFDLPSMQVVQSDCSSSVAYCAVE